ncbi:RNA methyltransferase [Methylobacterium nonmethylotrophicum]|uniref:RNA methyltransferase n=1 Tax=Methylobacterium nonmethylotrophicum TaxID=1141884 RepID=A0A4Z0NS32_9HYPH|nr:RNA methyltransferase [Methylobacterium nonmethylotrophicum]TGD99338.1 RNA methyltransferase [Methylobacterium nonmethylotrophicum]
MTDALPPRPAIILVEPQLAENIGMTARAMGNFGLDALRLVAPKGGWPMKGVRETASSATHVLDGATVFPTVAEALADLHYVLATTARERGQMKRVFGLDEGLAQAAGRLAAGERVGILFGRERVGLSNDEVSLADAIVTFPVDPQHASLNLAQSVLLVAYEWRRAAGQAVLPFTGEMRSGAAPREALLSLFESLEADLDAAGYYPLHKRDGMIRNMRDMFHRMAMTEQDVRTFRGALRALARRPPEE